MRQIGILTFGCMLIACTIHFFILPHHLIEGGILGVSLLISYLFTLPSGVTVLLLSVPIYLYAWHIDRKLIWYNLPGVCLIALLLDLLQAISPLSQLLPPLQSAWLGGSLIGVGIGLLVRSDITTDGLDLLARLISQKSAINIGIVIFMFDFCILCGGFWLLDPRQTLLSAITITAIGLFTTIVTMRSASQSSH